MKRLGAVSIALLATACSVVLGIDGDVIDRTPEFDLTSEASLEVVQGGTTKIVVTRAAGAADAPLEHAVLVDLPKGVTVSGANEIAAGASITLTLTATPNAVLGAAPIKLSANEVVGAATPLMLTVGGNLDTSFGEQGLATIAFAGVGGEPRFGLAVDGKNRIYVSFIRGAGGESSYRAAVARLDPSGKLDPSFGAGGILSLLDFPEGDGAIAVDVIARDDDYVLFGEASNDDTVFVPFSATKTPPAARFGPLTSDATVSALLQRVVKTGDAFTGMGYWAPDEEGVEADTFLFRADGMGAPISNAFAGSPYLHVPELLAHDLLAMPNGDLVLVGQIPQELDTDTNVPSDSVVRRLGPTGVPVDTFGDHGTFSAKDRKINNMWGGALDPAGNIVTVGEVLPDDVNGNGLLRVTRLTGTGQLDAMFDLAPPSGKGMVGYSILPFGDSFLVGAAIEEYSNFQLVSQAFTVLRLSKTGVVDRSFALDGFSVLEVPGTDPSQKTLTVPNRIVAHRDGAIVGATVDYQNGRGNVVLVRYKP